MNKLIKIIVVFLIGWLVCFFICGYTASEEIEINERIKYSAVYGAIIAALYCTQGGVKKTSGKAEEKSKNKDKELYIFEGEFGRKLVYRIQNKKIYNGLSNRCIYEIKGNKIYIALSSQWIYRIEENRIYKGLYNKVMFRIEKNKVYEGEFGKMPLYRITTSRNSA